MKLDGNLGMRIRPDQYRNCEPIPTVLDNASWQNTIVGADAIYNNDPANDYIYRKL